MPNDYIGEHYTPFEQNLALSWANSHFSAWHQDHQGATFDEELKYFFDCIEGGLSVALKFRKQNT